MNAPTSTPLAVGHLQVISASQECPQMPRNSDITSHCFLRCVISFAVWALLYHSVSVKNTTITESGLFVQDQVHSFHNVSPSKVKSSQKRQVTWRILR